MRSHQKDSAYIGHNKFTRTRQPKQENHQSSYQAMSTINRLQEDFANMGNGLIYQGAHSCFQPPRNVSNLPSINSVAWEESVNLATPEPIESESSESNDHREYPLLGPRMGRNNTRPVSGGGAPMLPDSFTSSRAMLFPRLGADSPLSLPMEDELPYLPLGLSSEASSSGPPFLAPKKNHPLPKDLVHVTGSVRH